jgi:glutathione-regulated potassium-efflux system ancillary protein KefG
MALSKVVGSLAVGQQIDVEDVIDAREVATILELSHPNTVSLYQRRYDDMPRPVIDMGQGRCKLWLRSEVAHWHHRRRRIV